MHAARIQGVIVMTWWWAVLLALLGGPPFAPSSLAFARAQAGGYAMSRKSCAAGGTRGACMWVQECIRAGGTHAGVCVDGFMFGSCCVLRETSTTASTTTSGTTSTHHYTTVPAVTITNKPYHPPSTVDTRPTTLPQASRPTRPLTQRPYFMTKPIDGSSSESGYKPPSLQIPTLGGDSSNNKIENNNNINVNSPIDGSAKPNSQPSLSSNKISSSPSIVVGGVAAVPQRGTARPMASITVQDNEAENSIPSAQWMSRPSLNMNTIHWQATTEPNFITKLRPASWEKPSSGRPKPTKKFTTTTPKSPTTKPSLYPKPTVKPPLYPKPTVKPQYYKPMKDPTSTSKPDGAEENSIVPNIHSSTVSSLGTTSATKSTECGVPALSARPETRIVGGKDAPFGRWPWQVSVRRTSFFGFSSTHRCGGAILNEGWIATAGHCVDDLLTSQIRIRVGEYDFSNIREEYPFVERGVARKAVHPKYNFFTYEYDLALVKLEQPLTFAAHISPICLPASDDLLIGENATVTGWGRLSEGGTLPSVLQEVQVPIVSNDRCKSMFLRAGRHEFIPDIFLCAGHERGGHDSCQGDSGGPLQVRGKDRRYFLAGVISWGIGCAEADLPGVCTRVSKFVPWILDTVT